MMELNKYELARVLGARATQISLGAPPMVKVPDPTVSSLDVAEMELSRKALPLVVMKEDKS